MGIGFEMRKEFADRALNILRTTPSQGSIEIVSEMLTESGANSRSAISEMGNERDETPDEAIRDILIETNRITNGHKAEEIVDGFLFLRSHAIVSQRKITALELQG